MREATKMPRSLLVTWRWKPVCVSRRTTVAPTTLAPDGSVTVPRMTPVVACDCAASTTGNARANTTGPRSLRTMLRPPNGVGSSLEWLGYHSDGRMARRETEDGRYDDGK